MSSAFLRAVRTIVLVLLILGLAVAGIGYAWYASEQTTEARRLEAIQQANAVVTGLASSYGEQINRHILALDQTLDMMARDWEADLRSFNLEARRARSPVLTGISRDMFLADQNGVIRQSSVPDFLSQNVIELEVFRTAVEHANDKPQLYLGGASVNPIMRQWHLDAARSLHNPDGSFAGIINADYRVAAINEVFATGGLTGNGFAAVFGLADGKLRATHGPVAATPDANIADTPMFAAADATETGLWVGPSSPDAVERIHAFRRIPGRDLVVIVGLDRLDVLQPVVTWQRQTRLFAAAVTGLTVLLSIILLNAIRVGRRRGGADRDVQARFASAGALADVARAEADATARRLHATFAAVGDGVAIFDPHLNLVEWNELFPQRSGVNASFIRTGMAIEEALRAQTQAGYFGEIADVETEVERRAALFRAGNFGASQSFEASGRAIELRCRPLPEGGFVAIYTDVTEARRARQATRDAQDALRREQSARMRFLNVISHELRARSDLLMRSIARLRPAPDATPDLDRVRGVGRAVGDLARDMVEVPLMEAGELAMRPALLAVRPSLREIVDTIQPAARDREITAYLVVNDTAPVELIADPDRIRQIVTLLVAEAFRFAKPETMWVLADGAEEATRDTVALRVTIRCFGDPIAPARLATLFPPIGAIAVSAPDAAPLDTNPLDTNPLDTNPLDQAGPGLLEGSADGLAMGGMIAGGAAADGPISGHAKAGNGLGAAIAQYLTTAMGGQLRCEGWSTPAGRTGNDFILTLPPDLLPGQRGRAPGDAPAEGRHLPRTRILLVGARTGLRRAAETMLRRDGHMVESVDTGAEALTLARTAPFDVLFMDTALPDAGAEAVIGVMRDETGPLRTVPIILLAPPHDDVEERAWRDAGADDILPQYPTLRDFADAIGRAVWLSRSSGEGLGFMPGFAEETEEGIPILSASRIAELRSNIPPDALGEMVEECISDLFHRLPALRRSLAAGAPGAISAQAHAMVGMAGGYGMAVLEARLRAILTAVRLRRLNTIDGAAAVVEADLTRAAAALRRTFPLGQSARSNARA